MNVFISDRYAYFLPMASSQILAIGTHMHTTCLKSAIWERKLKFLSSLQAIFNACLDFSVFFFVCQLIWKRCWETKKDVRKQISRVHDHSTNAYMIRTWQLLQWKYSYSMAFNDTWVHNVQIKKRKHDYELICAEKANIRWSITHNQQACYKQVRKCTL